MALYRWKLLNGGGLMKCKRWFGFIWCDFENYDNILFRRERKMLSLYEDFCKEAEAYKKDIQFRKDTIAEVNKSRDCTRGLSTPFRGPSFTGTRRHDLHKPKEAWRLFYDALKNVTGGKPKKKQTWSIGDAPQLDGIDRMLTPDPGTARAIEREASRAMAQTQGKGGNNNQKN